MEAALLIARIGLAAVLGVAASAKLADRPGAVTALEGFRVPSRLAGPLSWALPLMELAIAVGLLVSAVAAPAALAASSLLAVFTVAIVLAMRSEEPAECHCFGRLHSTQVGPGTLLRNLALLGLALFVAIAGWGDPGASATAWIADLSTTEALLLVGLVVAVLASVGSAALSWQLLRQNGRLWRRMAEVERRLEAPEPVQRVAGTAPAVRFEGANGEALELASLLEGRSRTMLVFTDPECGACQPVVAELARRRDRLPAAEHLVLVGHGDRASNRAYAAEHELDVVMQDGFDAARRLGVTALPGLVVLHRDGRFAAGPIVGSDAILGFLDSAPPANEHPPLSVVGGGQGAPA